MNIENIEELCKELIEEYKGYQYTKTFERHLRDLENLDKDKYRFNERLAKKYIMVIQSFKHSKGPLANTSLILSPWQIALISIAFGWESLNKNGKWLRRFSTLNIFIARKGGKTILSAGLAIADSIIRQQWGSEICCIATKRDQALLAWREIHGMINKHPDLKKKFRKSGNKLFSKIDDGMIYSLGRDSKTEDGLNISCIISDEYHAHANSELLDVCQSSQGAREQPLTIIISTAGFSLASPLIPELEHARAILDQNIIDESYFCFLAEPDQDDDPFCLESLKKANPNIGVSISAEYLMNEAAMAKQRPDKLVNYLTKHLNKFVNASEEFIKADDWKNCRDDEKDISEAHTMIIGADLSVSDDMSSIVCAYIFQDDSVHFTSHHWLPQQTIDELAKKFRAPLSTWVENGHMTASPGNYIDYSDIYDHMKDKLQEAEDMGMETEVRYDAFRFKQVKAALENEIGYLDCFPVNQGYLTMSEPITTIKNYIKQNNITYTDNPVQNWHCGNVEIQSDSYGNIKFDKTNRFRKIDGMSALADCFVGIIPRIGVIESSNDIIFI